MDLFWPQNSPDVGSSGICRLYHGPQGQSRLLSSLNPFSLLSPRILTATMAQLVESETLPNTQYASTALVTCLLAHFPVFWVASGSSGPRRMDHQKYLGQETIFDIFLSHPVYIKLWFSCWRKTCYWKEGSPFGFHQIIRGAAWGRGLEFAKRGDAGKSLAKRVGER